MNNRTSVSSPSFFPALVLLGVFILLLALLMPMPAAPLITPAAPASATAAVVVATEIPPTALPTEVASAYSAEMIAQGASSFQMTCAACHGFNARGISGLGKDLVQSPFMESLTDDELLQFIVVGRDPSDPLNTTGMPMPARGGNPGLTDEQIHSIIAYLRSEADVLEGAAAPTAVPTEVSAAAPSATLPPQPTILPTRIPVTPKPFSAETAYDWSCAGCHGAEGNGNEPFGPGFMESDLMDDRAALLAFLSESKPPVDPALEYPHPVRGGYPVLTDEQLEALVDYLLQLHVASGS